MSQADNPKPENKHADDDLAQVFHQEMITHLDALDTAMMAYDVATETDQYMLLSQLHHTAQTMKDASHTLGWGTLETLAHYITAIFETASTQKLTLTADLSDAIYDSVDLMRRYLDDNNDDDALIAEVLGNLEQGLAQLTVQVPAEPTITPTHAVRETDEVNTIDTNTVKLIDLFRVEADEYLTSLNEGILRLEMADGEEKVALLREMNRIAHSLKGASRAVGIALIETIGHYMEDFFQLVLAGDRELQPENADTLYDGLDLIQNTLQGIESDADVVAQVLVNLAQLVAEDIPTGTDSREIPSLSLTESNTVPVINVEDPPPPPLPSIQPDTIHTRKTIPTTVPNASNQQQDISELPPTMLIRPAEESIRVAVSKLDQLMATASELLVAKQQGELRTRQLKKYQRDIVRWQRDWRSVRASYIRLARRMQDSPDNDIMSELRVLFNFLENNQRNLSHANRNLAQLEQQLTQDNMQLSTLADQLQEDVSALRLMPFETITGGFQRMIRDLARDINKQAQLEIIGGAVEVDKTVLDALKDPLMHLLRNAIDHGIESPETRLNVGKSPTGRLEIIVEQRGSEIVIRIRDDGHGIDANKVKYKAIEQGLITQGEAEHLAEEDVYMLIFQAGFSTSDTVTAISGRGIGMDIVRTRVEGLRGRISIQNTPRQGTEIMLNVPVSLTRIRAIMMRVGEEDYAIPSVMVSRMDIMSRSEIFTAEGRDMILLNERPTPLYNLADILGSPVDLVTTPHAMMSFIALQAFDRLIAFEVNMLYSEVELVLKPLGQELANAPFVAGASLLGSGDVLIVLDANDLVRHTSGVRFPMSSPAQVTTPPVETGTRPLRVLVVDDSITTRTLEKNILEAIGFEVHVAIDGVEAWGLIDKLKPDLVVSDVEMPNMNGLELTRTIKSDINTHHIPVILLTSLSKPEQRQAGLEAGANAYLVKSRFDQGELLETIQSVIL